MSELICVASWGDLVLGEGEGVYGRNEREMGKEGERWGGGTEKKQR